MTNMENGDGMIAIINFINHAIIADTDASAFASGQFSTTGRPRIITERESRREYVAVWLLVCSRVLAVHVG